MTTSSHLPASTAPAREDAERARGFQRSTTLLELGFLAVAGVVLVAWVALLAWFVMSL